MSPTAWLSISWSPRGLALLSRRSQPPAGVGETAAGRAPEVVACAGRAAISRAPAIAVAITIRLERTCTSPMPLRKGSLRTSCLDSYSTREVPVGPCPVRGVGASAQARAPGRRRVRRRPCCSAAEVEDQLARARVEIIDEVVPVAGHEPEAIVIARRRPRSWRSWPHPCRRARVRLWRRCGGPRRTARATAGGWRRCRRSPRPLRPRRGLGHGSRTCPTSPGGRR